VSLSKVYLSLLAGPFIPLPAPPLLMNALESVQVTENDGFTEGFQLTFRAERSLSASVEYALLSSPLLNAGNRVILTVTVNAWPRVLMDGIITHHQLSPSGGKAGASLTVTGKDLSVLMDRTELAMIYPAMPHEMIVLLVLLRYAAYGITPLVFQASSRWNTSLTDQANTQRGTDRAYLQELAGQHGFTFGIKPGPVPGLNVAYWGPPDQISRFWPHPNQKPLTVDMGPASNVQSINFTYDPAEAKQVRGLIADPNGSMPVAVLAMTSSRTQPLASRPALLANPFLVKKSLLPLNYQGYGPAEARARAQDEVDRSADQVVTARGTLDVLRYGDLLGSPGIVGLRGAGYSYDGHYIVKSVSHMINRREYTQTFDLAREGTGSLAITV
jgi:hypothetical protein